MKLNFDDWMKQVNKEVERLSNLSSDDLPDCCYADWHKNGISPKAAAKRAIKNSNE